MHGDLLLFDSLFLPDCSNEIINLSVNSPATTSSAREVERAVGFFPRVNRKTATAFIERLFAILT